ncbi:U3-aranetoxin-Ce1a-like [Mya arenaria]|uniref:U3-aranetoxin-Ce1a-like n=1 Tax=Mya arenaria TaxID=6604 RepID=UPI0022DFA567|nr:U3-aranetoxin-Ce1a-like [Mya arenaria]XP_052771401.1 U3-aranetoxin-Ce1a-like [Mya arenaria]
MNALCVIALVAVADYAYATVCTKDSNCASNQCCYIEPEVFIVSKKRLLFPTTSRFGLGVCEDYKSEGMACSPLEKMNNRCSCGPGMSCEFVWLSTTVPTRLIPRTLYYPGPGSYECVKHT